MAFIHAGLRIHVFLYIGTFGRALSSLVWIKWGRQTDTKQIQSDPVAEAMLDWVNHEELLPVYPPVIRVHAAAINL